MVSVSNEIRVNTLQKNLLDLLDSLKSLSGVVRAIPYEEPKIEVNGEMVPLLGKSKSEYLSDIESVRREIASLNATVDFMKDSRKYADALSAAKNAGYTVDSSDNFIVSDDKKGTLYDVDVVKKRISDFSNYVKDIEERRKRMSEEAKREDVTLTKAMWDTTIWPSLLAYKSAVTSKDSGVATPQKNLVKGYIDNLSRFAERCFDPSIRDKNACDSIKTYLSGKAPLYYNLSLRKFVVPKMPDVADERVTYGSNGVAVDFGEYIPKKKKKATVVGGSSRGGAKIRNEDVSEAPESFIQGVDDALKKLMREKKDSFNLVKRYGIDEGYIRNCAIDLYLASRHRGLSDKKAITPRMAVILCSHPELIPQDNYSTADLISQFSQEQLEELGVSDDEENPTREGFLIDAKTAKKACAIFGCTDKGMTGGVSKVYTQVKERTSGDVMDALTNYASVESRIEGFAKYCNALVNDTEHGSDKEIFKSEWVKEYKVEEGVEIKNPRERTKDIGVGKNVRAYSPGFFIYHNGKKIRVPPEKAYDKYLELINSEDKREYTPGVKSGATKTYKSHTYLGCDVFPFSHIERRRLILKALNNEATVTLKKTCNVDIPLKFRDAKRELRKEIAKVVDESMLRELPDITRILFLPEIYFDAKERKYLPSSVGRVWIEAGVYETEYEGVAQKLEEVRKRQEAGENATRTGIKPVLFTTVTYQGVELMPLYGKTHEFKFPDTPKLNRYETVAFCPVRDVCVTKGGSIKVANVHTERNEEVI